MQYQLEIGTMPKAVLNCPADVATLSYVFVHVFLKEEQVIVDV